jgi:3-oxoacyl-[acyl-carrier-protein] synthase II
VQDRRRSSILHSMPGAATSLAAVAHGIRGPVTTIANGCVSGQQAIGLGCSLLRADDADAVLVVGYDFPLVPELIRLYAAMGDGALCRRRDPDGAMMPYDRHRDGFVLGEGAVALCLQRGAARQFQGRGPYARVIGHRSRCEGGHPMTMDLTGKLTAELMAEALATGGVSPQHVGYICGHGSATHYNDLAEARARAALYPTTAPDQLPPLGSVKPVYGHGLGAAGTLNAAAVALMLRDQCLAPTLNCHDPDPECGPNHVSAGPLVADLKAAVSLAFGLGGQSSVLVMSVAK